MDENNTEAEAIDTTTEETTASEAKLSKGDILKVIANALKIGTITSAQAAQARAEFGVFSSEFTKSKTKASNVKAKRKAQKKARAITRRKKK